MMPDPVGASINIGGKPGSSVDVVDFNAFSDQESSSIQQRTVNRNRAFIVQVGFGDRGAMDFAFHQRNLHFSPKLDLRAARAALIDSGQAGRDAEPVQQVRVAIALRVLGGQERVTDED